MYGGGAERAVSILTDALAEKNHDVRLIIYSADIRDYDINPNVKVDILYNGNREQNGLKRVLGASWKIRNKIKKYSPDVVIPFLDTALRDVMIATILKKTKVIATLRNNPINMSKKTRRIQEISYWICDAVYMQTLEQKNMFPKKIREKSFVLPNAVSNKIIAAGNSYFERAEIKKIATLGRLTEQKNHKLLIDAFSALYEKFPNVELYIYGEGHKKTELEEYISNGNINNVFIMGRTNDVLKVLYETDLFVLSSDYEGMPNALMEAMAMGVPCISTDCPTGPSELIGNNERGMLVPINDKEKLSEAMYYMIDNPLAAFSWGKKAHNYICSNYSADNIASSLNDICYEICRK
jgi:glycosyltransferase involved in cell wall biosynthesis